MIEDEKPPDTEPVPTPPFAPKETNSIVEQVRNMKGAAASVPARGPTKGKKYGVSNSPRKPGTQGLRTVAELISESEAAEGKVAPERVLMLLIAYRGLEQTNRAQRDLIQKLGAELSALKRGKR